MVRTRGYDRKQRAQLERSLSKGDDHIRVLIHWLNEMADNDPRKSRICELLALVRQLSSRVSESGESQANPGSLADEINVQLSRYKAVRFVLPLKGRGATLWAPLGTRMCKLSDLARPAMPKPGEIEQSLRAKEHWIVHGLIDALEDGDLGKIGQCQCGQFFFARFSLARFCSAKCRIEFWESSPERQEQKRQKARQYYRMHKTMNTK